METGGDGPGSGCALDAAGELGANARDLVAVRVELRGGGAAGLEEGAHVDEALQLENEILDLPLSRDRDHAASSSGMASGAMSSSDSGRFGSSISAESTAPARAIAAST